MNNSNKDNINDSLPITSYVPRPRIDKLLDEATKCKLVYVIAGAGYGKTQAVRQYIKQQEHAAVRWMQLTESDNIGTRYWNNLIHSIAPDNPDLADSLREFGFPETPARFRQFADILKRTEGREMKTFLVLDDFHLIHSEQALAFAERCAHLYIPGACVIIISRKEPEINVVSLLVKGQVHIITEDELQFKDDEVLDFLKQSGIQFPAKKLPTLMDATKGWAIAIQLFALSLKRSPTDLDSAIENTKQNIFKLMETEAFDDFPEDIQKILVKLSLVSNLPLTVLPKLFDLDSFFRDAPQLSSFVWFDSFAGTYRVHPLYWEFLHSKQDILTFDEKQIVYRRAAQWCADNYFSLDAMYYHAQSRDYELMVKLLFSFPFKLPHDTCEYFLEIIENLDPDNEDKFDENLLLLKNFFVPLLLMGMGKYEEAGEKTLAIIKRWETLETPGAYRLLSVSYSNLAYIDFYTCTVTHKYDAPKYIKKSKEYYDKAPLPPVEATGAFFVADVRAFACLVGEGAGRAEFDEFVEATKQRALYTDDSHHSMYYGYENLVDCELAFFRNQPDLARIHAHQTIVKARERKQYSIEAMAAQYLLRISMLEGDYPLAKETLAQMRSYLDNPDFWNRQLLYDLFTGFFYAQIGLPRLAPSWLIIDDKEANSEVHLPVKELYVCVKCHIASKKYNQALTVLSNSYPREPQERFLLSEETFSLLSAVARSQTGDIEGALDDFAKAYTLSLNGEFEMPFIELGKNLHPLVTAALEHADCDIPEQWLKGIDRKASIYAKKVAVILNSYKEENKIADAPRLSKREREVLDDLSHGLSREEIAENRYLSVNTVKKILQSIYIKLDANNNADAIRIALEKNLIE